MKFNHLRGLEGKRRFEGTATLKYDKETQLNTFLSWKTPV